MAGLRRETVDGVTDSLTLLDARIIERFDEQARARVRTPLPIQDTAGNEVQLNQSDDEIYVEQSGSDIFGGVLRDVDRSGSRAELIAGSFERYARDAKPSSGSKSVTKDDDVIVSDAIGDVSELSTGTVESIKNDLSFTFHHATPALRIRLARKAAGGEIQYNADKTVDYKKSLGSDKTGTTISPSNQQFTERVQVTKQAGSEIANHIRVIGADGTSVDVEYDGFNPSAEREKWRRAYFRDTSDSTTLTKRGETLLNQLSTPETRIRATLTNPPNGSIDPQLGDSFTVDYPEKDVNSTTLRVVERTHQLTTEGEFYEVALSNRTEPVEDQTEAVERQLATRPAPRTIDSGTVTASDDDTTFVETAITDATRNVRPGVRLQDQSQIPAGTFLQVSEEQAPAADDMFNGGVAYRIQFDVDSGVWELAIRLDAVGADLDVEWFVYEYPT